MTLIECLIKSKKIGYIYYNDMKNNITGDLITNVIDILVGKSIIDPEAYYDDGEIYDYYLKDNFIYSKSLGCEPIKIFKVLKKLETTIKNDDDKMLEVDKQCIYVNSKECSCPELKNCGCNECQFLNLLLSE